MSRVIRTHLFSNPDLLYAHIQITKKYTVHTNTSIERRGFLWRTQVICSKHLTCRCLSAQGTVKSDPHCVLAPLYHIGDPKELQDGQGQPLGTSQPHNKALSILQPAQTPCWNSPRFTFPEVHQFSAHITFPWSGVVCRQVLRLQPKTKPAKLQAGCSPSGSWAHTNRASLTWLGRPWECSP